MAAGRKTGGRKPGSLNKRTLELQALAQGEPEMDSPLDFLTSVFRNVALDLDYRIEAAKAAAPYVHPRLAAVTLKGDEDNPVRVVERIELVPIEPDDDGQG